MGHRLLRLVIGLIGIAAVGFDDPANAREVFFTEPSSLVSKVQAVDTATNQPVGAPISVGTNPHQIAITPDGSRAYVANAQSDSVSVIDLGTGQTVGSPIPVGVRPQGIAIAPDGLHVYVTNTETGQDSVSVIDTRTNQTVGSPITVGPNPGALAITPDSTRAYVANTTGTTVSVIDLRTNQTVGSPITVGDGPLGIAVTPEGSRVYVANHGSDNVSVIDTATNQTVGAPIPAGDDPEPLAMSPDGSRVIVGGYNPKTVTIIDTATNQPVGSPISLPISPNGIAITPDGARAYLTNDDGSMTGPTIMDVRSGAVTNGAIVLNQFTSGVAVAPNQPPHAAFSPGAPIAGRPVNFNAAGSTDPDGTIARYDWSFGDGSSAPSAGPMPSHTFGLGKFEVRLTLTDNEGCSTGFVFTGQTASCSGGSVAAASAALTTRPSRPRVTRVSQSARRWTEASGLPRITRRSKLPVGTTFRFRLNEAARMRLAFTQARPGRRVGRRCVPVTKRNRGRRACKRTVTVGVLSFNGHTGANRVRFKGRISRRKKLRTGRYTLVITARDSAGAKSTPRRLSFAIVKR